MDVENLYGTPVHRLDEMDIAWGYTPPQGTLRYATPMEDEFGAYDPNVITKQDLESGTAVWKLQRHAAAQLGSSVVAQAGEVAAMTSPFTELPELHIEHGDDGYIIRPES